jgi:hypothetical protein
MRIRGEERRHSRLNAPVPSALSPQEDRIMPNLYPIIGAAVALAGGDKLAGNKDYSSMFRSLGWSKFDMQAAAAAEIAGGALMLPERTRRIGGAILAVTSAAVLLGEVHAREPKLAVPRALLLLAGVAALVAPRRRTPKVVYVD